MNTRVVFDGWELTPITKEDRAMIVDLWNKAHPNQKRITSIGSKKEIDKIERIREHYPHIVIRTKTKPQEPKVFVYCGSLAE